MTNHVSLLIFVIIHCAVGLHLPPNIKICKHASGDYENCLKEAIQDAVPKLEKGLADFNLPSIQPVRIPSLTIGEGAGAVHVVQKYTNVEIYNIVDLKVTTAKINITEGGFILDSDLHFDEVRLEADYDFNGQILVVPVVGTGRCTITLKDLSVHITLNGEKFKKKDKDYIELSDFKVQLNPKRVVYDFKNFLGNDEKLNTEVKNLFNENWKEVFDDVKSGYEEALGAVFKNLANFIFTKVPHDEIFPE